MTFLRRSSRSPWMVVFLVVCCAGPAHAQALEPIRYTVSFPAPPTNYGEVEASVPTDGRSEIELMMAVWSPGSYLVREYARHVEGLSATDSARTALRIEKTRKNRWRITSGQARNILLR